MRCPEKQTNVDVVHVVLTYMGKFHVRNVTESRDFQYLRVVVRKDVAPLGIRMNKNCTYGVQKKETNKRRTLHHVVGCALNLSLRIDFPLTFIVRFKSLVYRKRLELPLKNWFSDLVPAIVLSSKSSKLTPTCSLIVGHKFLLIYTILGYNLPQ